MRTLQKFAADMQKAGNRDLPLKLQRLAAAMALEGESYAKRTYGKNGLGVVTGRLKQSIMGRALSATEGIGLVLMAGDKEQVVYAAVHEFGFSQRNIPPRPYIAPAIEHVRKQLPSDLRKAVAASVLNRPWTP
jgi:phage gpG-like protein